MSIESIRNYTPSGFAIPRFSDKQLVDRFRALATEIGSDGKAVVRFLFADQEAEINVKETDAHLRRILDFESITIKQLALHHSNVFVIMVHRPTSTEKQLLQNQDNVTINCVAPGNSLPSIADFVKVFASARKVFEPFDAKPFLDLLAEGTRQVYQAREQDIQKLERMQEGFFTGIHKFTLEQQQKQQAFSEELEKQYIEKQKTLDATYSERDRRRDEDYSQKLKDLDAKEVELKKIRAELDERENRQARRDIYKELKSKIAQRNIKFELTEGTRGLRGNVSKFTIFLLVVFGLGFAICFYRNVVSDPQQINWLTVGSQIALGLIFVGVATFFIRWNHQWFQRHADEEFRLKRLDLDIDRADWLVELAMEWKNITKSEISPDLIDKLSRSMFTTEDGKDIDIHPLETLLSSVLGKDGEINILPGKFSLRRSERDDNGKMLPGNKI